MDRCFYLSQSQQACGSTPTITFTSRFRPRKQSFSPLMFAVNLLLWLIILQINLEVTKIRQWKIRSYWSHQIQNVLRFWPGINLHHVVVVEAHSERSARECKSKRRLRTVTPYATLRFERWRMLASGQACFAAEKTKHDNNYDNTAVPEARLGSSRWEWCYNSFLQFNRSSTL